MFSNIFLKDLNYFDLTMSTLPRNIQGGATALLLAFMVKKEKPRFNVEAFAFGPPPSFAPLSNIPSPISRCMHSFIHGEDLVPRLSLASCTKVI